jgi:hypothetical protein
MIMVEIEKPAERIGLRERMTDPDFYRDAANRLRVLSKVDTKLNAKQINRGVSLATGVAILISLAAETAHLESGGSPIDLASSITVAGIGIESALFLSISDQNRVPKKLEVSSDILPGVASILENFADKLDNR